MRSITQQGIGVKFERRSSEIGGLAMVLDWAYKYGTDVRSNSISEVGQDVRSNDIGAIKKEGFEYAIL